MPLMSQMWLRSRVAVAGSCSSDAAPSLGTSICRKCGPKKQKKKKKKSVGGAFSTHTVWLEYSEGLRSALSHGGAKMLTGQAAMVSLRVADHWVLSM